MQDRRMGGVKLNEGVGQGRTHKAGRDELDLKNNIPK